MTTTPGSRTTMPRRTDGIITGAVLRLARESTGRTQDDLAELLHVSTDTLQGWETGRRPLTNRKATELITLRRKLALIEVHPAVLDAFDLAQEADWFLTAGIDGHDGPLEDHPLACWVNDRHQSRMLEWAFTGQVPIFLAGHARPRTLPPAVPATDRAAFFGGLQELAERSLTEPADPAAASLLRQQAYYMLSWQGRSVVPWLDGMERREKPGAAGNAPQVIVQRSLAMHRANQHDPEPLRRFIATTLDDEKHQAADLNYWAHWVGKTRGAHDLAAFAVPDIGAWHGAKLYRVLVANIADRRPHTDLCIHSLHSLTARRPTLLHTEPDTTATLATCIDQLAGSDLVSPQSRRELSQLAYAARLAGADRKATA